MKKTIDITINAWFVCIILLIINLVTIGLWQPWSSTSGDNRTITITGTSVVEAEPDQFVFSPYYQESGNDKGSINEQLVKLSETIIAKLKELGVSDSSIKTDINSYAYDLYHLEPSDKNTSTLYITLTINDKTLAQKVQDYLITTEPSGSISPQVSFSNDKQKELETNARTKALADAKSKADSTAEQLDAKIGKVVSVTDYSGNGIYPYPLGSVVSDTKSSPEIDGNSSTQSYSIQPGLNQYQFTVEVVYELK